MLLAAVPAREGAQLSRALPLLAWAACGLFIHWTAPRRANGSQAPPRLALSSRPAKPTSARRWSRLADGH
jgi:hypothetical protein